MLLELGFWIKNKEKITEKTFKSNAEKQLYKINCCKSYQLQMLCVAVNSKIL